MTTAIEARNASALALCKLNGTRVPHHMDEVASELVMRTAWPILSAGLRELHAPMQNHYGPDFCDTCRGWSGTAQVWPCTTVRELDRIDKELGL